MEESKNLDKDVPSEPTEEEKKKEAEALEEVKDDEIRSQVIDNYELDGDIDSDLINKIVKNTQEHKKELSVAIRQKIERRTEVQGLRKKYEGTEKKDETDKGKEKKDEPKYITAEELDERDRKKDLDALEVSDELKKEVESLAKLNKVSVKTAFASDYIQFRKKAEDEKKREEEASAGGDRGTPTISNLSTMTEEEINVKMKGIDRSTKEGLKEWDAFKQQLKKL